MSMTFLELQTEFYARGFDYVNQDAAGRTRAKRWLNEAYLEDICEPYAWDFLITSTSGTAPVTISDLRDVISVADSTNENQLDYRELRDVVDLDPKVDDTGTAAYWYLTGATTLAVYPLDSSSTFSVRYLKVPTELSADADTPILPGRMHPLIVDGAVVRAYRDSDNWDAAGVADQHFQARLQRFAASIMWKTSDPGYVVQTDWAA